MNPQLCAICGGSLEPKTITHRQSWGDQLVEFEDVPAMVCRQCGESWLGPEAIDLIEAVVQNMPTPKRFHQVPVYSLNDFANPVP